MIKLAVAYGATAVVFAVLDFIWLSLAGPKLYKPIIGELLAPKVRLGPAVAFYVIYIAGLVYLAVWPALADGRWTRALVSGAVLGFVAYATYDLTNQATMKVWSTKITLMDLGWGTLVSAAAATAGFLAVRMFAGR